MAMSSPPEVCASQPRCTQRFVHARRHLEVVAQELAVALDRAGNDAVAKGFDRAVEGGQGVGEHLRPSAGSAAPCG